jgi:hypothetical protein
MPFCVQEKEERRGHDGVCWWDVSDSTPQIFVCMFINGGFDLWDTVAPFAASCIHPGTYTAGRSSCCKVSYCSSCCFVIAVYDYRDLLCSKNAIWACVSAVSLVTVVFMRLEWAKLWMLGHLLLLVECMCFNMFVMFIQLERGCSFAILWQECANGSGLLGSDTLAGLVFALF